MISVWCARAVASSVIAATVCVAPWAHADHESSSECGEFGFRRFILGAALGLGTASVSALTFPAVARATTPGLKYWPGVGYTMATGTTAVVGSIAVLSDDWPESRIYVPSVVAMSTSLVTTVIWAAASRPKQPTVSLHVGTPCAGHGVSATLLGSL